MEMKPKTIARIMAAALAAAGLGLIFDDPAGEAALDVFALKKIFGAAFLAMAACLGRKAGKAAGKEGEA